MINKDLSNSYVRVDVICDREGFWLNLSILTTELNYNSYKNP